MSKGSPNLTALIAHALTAPPIDKGTPLYEALGRFITAYANAEVAVHRVARKVSGLPDDKARILFSGMRLDHVIERIRALLAIDDPGGKTIAELEDCFKQLRLIGERRHRLVHRATTIYPTWITVTNVHTSKNIQASEVDHFTVLELGNMQADCGVIYLRLTEMIEPTEAFDPAHKATFDEYLHRPWLYQPKQDV